ncbi:MAG TPA: choice-of-anchor J domain-containing protein [Flavobacterium sp.]|nr:choice-of-anchor J domain-containing protein [Flavobacterium sp.]
MQKYTRLLFVVLLSGLAPLLTAQTTLLDQSMLSAASFNSFTTYSVAGTQTWNQSNQYGATCTGYSGGQNYQNEDWLISPTINLTQTDNVKLTFDHTRGTTAIMNVGVELGWYSVYATANYTGDPTTTQWIELTGINQNIPVGWQFIPSGELVVPEAAKSANSRIAFRYMSSNTQSATWEIKNIKVKGEPQGSNPNAGLFKVTNWNTEWLGCTQFGPVNETQQLNNVAAAMLAMNSDVFCLQEVSNTATVGALVTLLGPEWSGSVVPVTASDCDQRQAIIYKTARVQLVGATELSTGSPAQGNSYAYNWSSGRFPALYTVNFLAGENPIPVSLVNIHAKAEDGNASSYTRRLGASQGLKAILDGAAYNTKNLIVIGDFNDYLVGTTSTSCACTDSPYKNFTDDTADYNGITKNFPIIEHLIVSNELSGNYVAGSAAQEVAVAQNIFNFYNTTSNHLPVSASFQFQVLGDQAFAKTPTWSVYPNPAKTQLHYDNTGLDSQSLPAVYDLTGRPMRVEKTNDHTIDVAALPSGVYLLKVGARCVRFVKE